MARFHALVDTTTGTQALVPYTAEEEAARDAEEQAANAAPPAPPAAPPAPAAVDPRALAELLAQLPADQPVTGGQLAAVIALLRGETP